METTYRYKGWEKFVAGDDSCFEIVFKEHYQNLYGYGIKLCNRPELVEDSIQELFEKIWEKRDELSHINSPNVYLTVSLRRRLLKKLQRLRDKKRKLEKRDEAGDDLSIYFGVEEVIVHDESIRQQKQALLNALNQLPQRQKEVIHLRFYQGMSYGEIETILSINRQSVRNHVYRAMETLRSLLNEEVVKSTIASYSGTFLL